MDENQTLEFKSSWSDEWLKQLSSFCNRDGGKLIIGIDDDGNVVGVTNTDELLKKIPNKIRNHLGVTPEVKIVERDKKSIIEITITPSSNPISYRGRFYMRSGNNTFELQSSELTSFLISKSGNSWDEFIEDKASLDDIDIKTIEKFKQLASADRKYISKEADLPTLLERLHLMRDGKITKAGILLFGKEPQSFFPQAYLRMGKFKTETEVKDSVDILGNLFITLETAMGILETKYLMSEYKIGTGSLARSEILEYPRKALREAIINSLIHRDYTGTGHTQLKVLPDRLCLWNEGGLPGGFTIEDLKKPHNSRPRNVLLANIFHEANLVETWGTGTIRMLEACQENGLPEPDFNEEGSGFSVTLYKDMYNEEYLSTLDLTERQILATLYAKEKGSISIAELSQLVSKSPATLKRDLKSLVEKGLLKPVGEKRGRKYIPIR